MATPYDFPALGVARGGPHLYAMDGGQKLGMIAGATAAVVAADKAAHMRSGGKRAIDAAAATALLGPVGLLAGLSRRQAGGIAIVILADGTTHERKLEGDRAILAAQAEAVRFNAMALAAT